LLLEKDFLALKERKSTMQTAAFYDELEPLLVSIAQLQKKIDETTGWKDTHVED